mmetsp:Transcript_14208/g.39113  ORF Transcript_14208/g.39113 Transcript_14208/m.39113 type:complete len:242 (+) Transcript_14208:351-1076(+)
MYLVADLPLALLLDRVVHAHAASPEGRAHRAIRLGFRRADAATDLVVEAVAEVHVPPPYHHVAPVVLDHVNARCEVRLRLVEVEMLAELRLSVVCVLDVFDGEAGNFRLVHGEADGADRVVAVGAVEARHRDDARHETRSQVHHPHLRRRGICEVEALLPHVYGDTVGHVQRHDISGASESPCDAARRRWAVGKWQREDLPRRVDERSRRAVRLPCLVARQTVEVGAGEASLGDAGHPSLG